MATPFSDTRLNVLTRGCKEQHHQMQPLPSAAAHVCPIVGKLKLVHTTQKHIASVRARRAFVRSTDSVAHVRWGMRISLLAVFRLFVCVSVVPERVVERRERFCALCGFAQGRFLPAKSVHTVSNFCKTD